MELNIKPKIGIDSIKLGMTKSQVISSWGEPQKKENRFPNKEDLAENVETWFYSSGVELDFRAEDKFVLSSITVFSQKAIYRSVHPIGLDKDELIEKLPELKLDDDFEENGCNYVDCDNELSFWISDGKVENITIFPAYDISGNNPIWPT